MKARELFALFLGACVPTPEWLVRTIANPESDYDEYESWCCGTDAYVGKLEGVSGVTCLHRCNKGRGQASAVFHGSDGKTTQVWVERDSDYGGFDHLKIRDALTHNMDVRQALAKFQPDLERGCEDEPDECDDEHCVKHHGGRVQSVMLYPDLVLIEQAYQATVEQAKVSKEAAFALWESMQP